MKRLFTLLICFCMQLTPGHAQKDTVTTALLEKDIPVSVFKAINRKYQKINDHFEKKQKRWIVKMHRSEIALRRRINKKGQLLDSRQNIDSQYSNLHRGAAFSKNGDLFLFTYNGKIDTLTTALAFLKKNQLQKKAINLCEESIGQLKANLNQSEEIAEFFALRQQYLEGLLNSNVTIPTVLSKRFNRISRAAYYYSEQVEQYRALVSNPQKREKRALELLQKLPAFQKFLRENSQLASVFRSPESLSDVASLAGLQTRESMEELIQQRIHNIGADGKNDLQQYLSSASREFQKLRDDVHELMGEKQDFDLPGFKPNSQKTKTFLSRIEYGFDVQFGKGNSFFPATANLGITAGYKLNDKSILGVGVAYKMGMGSIDHIYITHEGLG